MCTLKTSSTRLQHVLTNPVPGYSNISNKCLLSPDEKFEMINYPGQEEFAKETAELISKYCYLTKYLLSNYKSSDYSISNILTKY